MHRLLPRLAAALLCGASLAACSSAGHDSRAQVAQAQSADAAALGLPTDLDGEIRRAQELRAQGNLDEAVRALGQLMLVAPDDPRVVAEYGKALTQEDRPKNAVDFLSRATELSPGDWTVYSALGVAYDRLGDQAKARVAYEHALALKPGEPVVLNNYALSRLQAGDHAAAQHLIAQAEAAGSSDPKIGRNVDYIANYGPKPAAAAVQSAPQPAAVASIPQTAAPGKPSGAVASAAPRQLNPNVVMQAVPSDPLAGPVGRRAHQVAAKPAAAKPVATAAKPEVADKKNKTPALRMSADASE
jgi:Flp pilus assembly protein TadD